MDDSAIRMFLSMFAVSIPTLLVSVIGCAVVISNWRRLTSAAVWALLGFGIALLLCFVVPIAQTLIQTWVRQGGEPASRASMLGGLSFLWSMLRAVTYVFLILGVVMGRSRQAPLAA